MNNLHPIFREILNNHIGVKIINKENAIGCLVDEICPDCRPENKEKIRELIGRAQQVNLFFKTRDWPNVGDDNFTEFFILLGQLERALKALDYKGES